MKYAVYFNDNTVTQLIEVVQGDSARVLEFEAVDYDIPAGAEATYYIKRPSNVPVYNSATIQNNSIIIELTAEAIAEAGENLLQIRITEDGKFLTSFAVVLIVRRFGGIGAVEARGEINLFDSLIEELREQLSTAIDSTLTVENMAADAKATGEAIAGRIANEVVAEVYNESKQYVVGDYVIHEGELYRCVRSTLLPNWSPSYWTKIVLLDEVDSKVANAISGAIDGTLSQNDKAANAKMVGDIFNSIVPKYSSTEIYTRDDIVRYGNAIYICVVAEGEFISGDFNPDNWDSVILKDAMSSMNVAVEGTKLIFR